jgi:hypothetical protein
MLAHSFVACSLILLAAKLLQGALACIVSIHKGPARAPHQAVWLNGRHARAQRLRPVESGTRPEGTAAPAHPTKLPPRRCAVIEAEPSAHLAKE